jgi:hypothetical protein
MLIPLNFNSRIGNTYKKPQGEAPICNPKVCQLVTTRSFTTSFEWPLHISASLPRYVITSRLLAVLRTRRNSRNPNPLYALLHNFSTPRGVGSASKKLAHTPIYLSYHRHLSFQLLDLQVPRSREAA